MEISLSLNGCPSCSSRPTVPPPLDGKWKVGDDDGCTLGLGFGKDTLIEALPLKRDLFHLRLNVKPCSGTAAAHEHSVLDTDSLSEVAMVITSPNGCSLTNKGRCQENLISKADEDSLLKATSTFRLLQAFRDLSGSKIRTFMSGLGYLRDMNSEKNEAHLVLYFSYVVGPHCDEIHRKYILVVSSFDTAQPMHNGVVHGKP